MYHSARFRGFQKITSPWDVFRFHQCHIHRCLQISKLSHPDNGKSSCLDLKKERVSTYVLPSYNTFMMTPKIKETVFHFSLGVLPLHWLAGVSTGMSVTLCATKQMGSSLSSRFWLLLLLHKLGTAWVSSICYGRVELSFGNSETHSCGCRMMVRSTCKWQKFCCFESLVILFNCVFGRCHRSKCWGDLLSSMLRESHLLVMRGLVGLSCQIVSSFLLISELFQIRSYIEL